MKILFAIVLAITGLLNGCELDKRHKPAKAVNSTVIGKKYTAVAAVSWVNDAYFSPHVVRVMFRTKEDNFFDVFFRKGQQPMLAPNALGDITYYECGTENNLTVYCFESFKALHEGLPQLDNEGKTIVKK